MLISLMMPTGEIEDVEIADDVLVYNGSEFVRAADATYLVLYHVPVSAYTQPFRDLATSLIVSSYYVRAFITNKVAQTVAVSDPTAITASDPSQGQCLCFVTCNGTDLSYVKIHNVEE